MEKFEKALLYKGFHKHGQDDCVMIVGNVWGVDK
jgi:hypothetical protein